jgi:ATP-dependent RNA helicase DDX55/SPB4
MNDFSCSKLHSKIGQNKREKEYYNFKIEDNHKLNILLTTDLSARGIDIPDVDIILQFDPPKNEDSYIHKAGRTARVGNTGVSIIFLCEEELSFINYMKQKFIYIENFPSLLKEEYMEDKIDNKSILQCIKDINISDKWIYDKAVNSFVSFIKFYHEIELKYIFDYRQLDLGNLANSFQLLKLPRLKIKEFNNESIKNFEKDNNIVPKDLKYLNSNIEKQMNEKKEKIYLKLNEFHQKKREREEMKINFNKNNQKKINRTRKEKKEAKMRQIIEQWDDLADDELMYKKYKKGKISKEEYEKYLLKIK